MFLGQAGRTILREVQHVHDWQRKKAFTCDGTTKDNKWLDDLIDVVVVWIGGFGSRGIKVRRREGALAVWRAGRGQERAYNMPW